MPEEKNLDEIGAAPCPPDAARLERPDVPDVARAMEAVVGCKWAVAILDRLRRGIARPGAIERDIAGLSTKVMNERLTKMLRFGLIEREAFPEVPPRVEYRLTPLGDRFAGILDELRSLQAELDAEHGADAP